jgi:enamine deaminase RidA (YjgF/YER057c/UK114 family)
MAMRFSNMAQYGGNTAKWQERSGRRRALSRIVEAQSNLPSRSVVQVAGLANPGLLVEIEVTAVRP